MPVIAATMMIMMTPTSTMVVGASSFVAAAQQHLAALGDQLIRLLAHDGGHVRAALFNVLDDDAGKFAHFRRTGADAKVINGLGTGRAVIHFAAGFLHQVVNDALLALGHDVPGFLQDHAAVHQQRQFGNHVGKLHHALFAALFKLVAHLICTVGIDDGHHCHTGD